MRSANHGRGLRQPGLGEMLLDHSLTGRVSSWRRLGQGVPVRSLRHHHLLISCAASLPTAPPQPAKATLTQRETALLLFKSFPPHSSSWPSCQNLFLPSTHFHHLQTLKGIQDPYFIHPTFRAAKSLPSTYSSIFSSTCCESVQHHHHADLRQDP